MSCGIADAKEEEGWKIGCQQLISKSSFEGDFHFDAFIDVS